MSNYEDVYAPDLTEETESTLSGSEQFVMFDSVEGKRAELSTIADYIVANGEIDGSDIPTIVSTIEGNIGTLDTKVGDLTDLETTDKTDIVSAVNEVNGKAEDADAKADTVDEHVGDLSELETEDKTSAVDAINEVLSKIPVMTKEVTGNPIVVDDALGGVDSLTVELTPIQAGSGTPSPQNVRPITGHDSVTVGVTGKNLIQGTIYNSSFYSGTVGSDLKVDSGRATWTQNGNILSVTATANWFGVLFATDVLKAGTYHLHYNSSDTSLRCAVFETDKDLIVTRAIQTYGGNLVNVDVTVTDGKRIAIGICTSSAGTVTVSDLQVEYGNAFTSYESYHGQSTTVTLPHTVYGGTVGVTDGEGQVKMAIVDLGTLNWVKSTNMFISTGIATTVKPPTSGSTTGEMSICSAYGAITVSEAYAGTKNGYAIVHAADASAGNLWISDNSLISGTAAEFKTAMSGVYLCYELATPTDLTTTPTDITLYNGDNTVSADGDMDMVYVRDIVKVIEKLEG